ncbi:DUF3800 domain-containing protein [Pseudomonas aeruginosa]|uniref:DUF3800 domain-containing protein n=1 Tax=Pseudomonas aeruginosa TaxID=287 RepID=UPI000EAB9C3E|nr:DUF3800 domain-containing protein [Pseudomonas aeruginosa]
MKIYIDESGLFDAHTKMEKIDKAWCTVGALTVPHFSEKQVKIALAELKRNLGIKSHEEIKKSRPSPDSPDFIEFVEKLKKAKCTLHAVTTNRFLFDDKKTEAHKQRQIAGRENYLKLVKPDMDNQSFMSLRQEADRIIQLIQKSSIQEYNQIIFQAALAAFMLDKTLTFYAIHAPKELSRFSWVIDQKNREMRLFESLYLVLMPPFVQGNFKREPRGIPITAKNNYRYFLKNYGGSKPFAPMSQEELKERKNIYGIDYSEITSSMMSFDFQKLLDHDSKFADSKTTLGLQVADIVISGLNRLLKGNVDDPVKAAKVLGPLILNAPRLGLPSIPQLNFYEGTTFRSEVNYENLELLNRESAALYNDQFRSGFTDSYNQFMSLQVTQQPT